MDFSDYFLDYVRKFAWDSVKNTKNNKYKSIKEVVSAHKKSLFLESFESYYKKYGIDRIIQQKPQIMHFAKHSNVTVLMILKKIYIYVGKEASEQFYHKKTYHKYFECIFLSLVVGLIIGFLMSRWM